MDPAAALRMQIIKGLITLESIQEHRFASIFVFLHETQNNFTPIMS